jgi:glycine cleavage system transcriptional repressor
VPQLAVAVLGPDQPGVVARLAQVLLADGGNLEDSSMTLLRGQFAMTLIVDVPRSADDVRHDLAEVATALDLLVSVRETGPHTDDLRPPATPYVLRLHGADQPGLVHRAAALLASYDVNITDLASRLVGSAAAPVYVMNVACDVPASAPVDALVAAVDALAGELGVEASLRPADFDLL